jgi:hypothetical protein
METDTI